VKAILYTGLAASAVFLASPALADNQTQDQTPLPPPAAAAPSTTTVMATPTPTPGLVGNTGGANSSSNPGSSCSQRLNIRNQPPGPSNIYLWTSNGDVGWPFGWPGRVAFNAIPTTAPSVGCSR
jgi:hypothetical protein